MKKVLQSANNATADLSPRWQAKREIFDNLFDKLCSQLHPAPGWHVAEFGIGKWGFGRFYAEYFSKVIGIDIEDYSERHPNVEFVISDGLVIPLPDNAVDLTVSHSVLEHVQSLDKSLAEINRITKIGGHVFLTVTPLYFAAYGAHLHSSSGSRLDNWEHLDPSNSHYMSHQPIADSATGGHDLNGLTSSNFLAAVGRQPWSILDYHIDFERKSPPTNIDSSQCLPIDLMIRGFRFIGEKLR